MNYEHKTAPFTHQARILEKSADKRGYALFWETGTGKSKGICDTAAYLAEAGEIDGILVIAPQNVHLKWAEKEVGRHVPDRVQPRAFAYSTARARSSGHKAGLRALTDGRPGLPFLCMSYPAMTTDAGYETAKAFLSAGRRMIVFDESRRIKTPSAERTKRAFKLAKLSPWRRIMSGTPVANGPFDVYGPIKLLEPDFWKSHGFGTFATFKSYFGVFEVGYAPGGRQFPNCVAYRRLDELQKILEPISDRVLKDDVLDLPPKLYDTITFELTTEQRRHYEELEFLFRTELAGNEITADMALARMLRLQQVTCGYLPGEGELLDIPGGNPRLTQLLEQCEDIPHQTIIWARFRRDVDLICEALKGKCVRYDGAVPTALQAQAIHRFQDGDAQFFVGNPAACGEGHDLYNARTVLYYSNSFDLDQRQQSEDRAHRIGTAFPVMYRDFEAANTIDTTIVNALRKKISVANAILGDRERAHL